MKSLRVICAILLTATLVASPVSTTSHFAEAQASTQPTEEAKPESENEALDPDCIDVPQSEPFAISPISNNESEASPAALTDQFVFKVSADSFYNSAAMHFREVGTSTWITMPRETIAGNTYQFSVSASSLTDDATYEYVASLLSPARTGNIGSLYYGKVVGTFAHGSEGAWTHENKNGETGLLSETHTAGTTTVTLNREPKYLSYKARAFSLETNVSLAHAYAAVPDVLDGTVQDMPAENLKWRKTYYVPAESRDTSSAAKSTLANAGYPFIGTEATNPDANSININDFTMPYSLETSLYEKATGTYRPNGHVLRKAEDELAADPESNHTVEVLSRQTATQFKLNLVQETPSILVSGLYEGSRLKGATPEDDALATITEASAGFNVEFDVGAETKTINLEIIGDGLFTVPLAFTVSGDTGSIAFDNQAEAEKYVESIAFDADNKLSVRQLPKLELEQNGPTIGARSESLFEYIQNTRSWAPGNKIKGEFRITNPRSDASFKVVDYRVSPDYRPFQKLLRTNSPAIRECFKRYYPEETFAGKVKHLYNFEALTSKRMSEALLEMYQERYPAIESLADLPTDVLASEIFFDDSDWRFSADRIDLSIGAYEQIDDSYVIIEPDETMRELANELLYNRALSITFDDSLYPLQNHLNDTDELEAASSDRLRLLYPSYRDKTNENRAMMNDIIGALPVLRPAGSGEDTILFDKFAFGLNGNLISNPYIKSNYEFSFDFEVVLSIVGIEGVAFVDSDGDGIRDDGETLLENVPITLHGSDGSTIGTRMTDSFGRYEFPDVAAGQGYWLETEAPDGLEITRTIVADHPDGNKFLPSGATDPFEIEADEAYRYNVGFANPAPVEYFTLSYHPNGGTGNIVDPTGQYASGDRATALAHNHKDDASSGFSKEGHEFVSWNELPDGSGKGYAPGEEIVMDGHKTLYAQWKPTESPGPGPIGPTDPENPARPDDPKHLPSTEKNAPSLSAAGDTVPGELVSLVAALAGATFIAMAVLLARRMRNRR